MWGLRPSALPPTPALGLAGSRLNRPGGHGGRGQVRHTCPLPSAPGAMGAVLRVQRPGRLSVRLCPRDLEECPSAECVNPGQPGCAAASPRACGGGPATPLLGEQKGTHVLRPPASRMAVTVSQADAHTHVYGLCLTRTS